MRKIESIQNSKMVSAYGGVGSIIETISNGSLKIMPYNQWPCFNEEHDPKNIEDSRLLKRIKSYVNSIENIYKIPTPKIDNVFNPGNDIQKCIKAEYFPSWYYCPKCRRLDLYTGWEAKWNNKFQEDQRNNQSNFNNNPPACYYCSNKRNNNGISRIYLEQMRFLMVSPNGNIKDIPLRELIQYKIDKKKKGEADNIDSWRGSIDISQQNAYNDELYLLIQPNSSGEDYIDISTKNPKEKGGDSDIHLPMTIMQMPYIITNDDVYKIYMRNQNNIYYPDRISSIYIPMPIDNNTIDHIRIAKENGRTNEDIANALNLLGINIEPNDIEFILEEYEHQEYIFITNNGFYNDENASRNIKGDNYFNAYRYSDLEIPFISKVYAIDRLKETSVVLEYSRLSPKGNKIKWLDKNGMQEKEDIDIKTKKTYDNNNPTFIPGVERYGEGLFFELNTTEIENYISSNNYNLDKLKTFTHTLSHIIMRELEFKCGYNLASMMERIYVLDENRAGILIYTVAGAFGGLVSLCEDKSIKKIVEQGLKRSAHCVNDPICESHCYACLDIPEISCCQWNKDLDRNILKKS